MKNTTSNVLAIDYLFEIIPLFLARNYFLRQKERDFPPYDVADTPYSG